MASPIRPQFFCSRPNGAITPLIALDELPAHISIRGVPRNLSPGDTQGMTSLGTVNPRAHSYVVDGGPTSPTRATQPNGRTPQLDLQASLLKVVADDSLPASQRLALHAFIQQSLAQNWVSPNSQAAHWLGANGESSTTPRQVRFSDSIRPYSLERMCTSDVAQANRHNAKKEYCSYWIRHGECDICISGCLYKHEMPSDPAMLEKLGLRDIPRWYREKYGIPSILPSGNHQLRSHGSHGQHWKGESQDRGHFKPIQYTPHLGMIGAPDVLPESEHNSPTQKTGNHNLTQQNILEIQKQNRPTYSTGPSQKGVVLPKDGARRVPPHQSLSTKKLDVFSFDPMTEYTPLSNSCVNLGELPYSGSNGKRAVDEAQRVQRDELTVNLQSLMPVGAVGATNDGFAPLGSSDSSNSPARTKKAQKSRRLYQPRSHVDMPPSDQHGTGESLACRNRFSSGAPLPSAPFTSTRGGISQLPSPIIGGGVLGAASRLSSGSRSRVESGSVKSQASTSSGSTKISPTTARFCGGNNRSKDKEIRSIPGAIGSHKVYSQRSVGSADDLIGLGVEHGK